ncbi:Glucose--fructose oxidoreductase precursor [Phycisphaerae bacterium RAS1]|nr:Glucose--fructose oxidoreductase precursor [Phycisphaerae bacterium RAS1]
MSDVCNVALIGQKFMGRAHSNAYLKAARFFNLPLRPVMHTIVGRDLISLAPFADRWGWKNYSTNWKETVRDPAIQLVDITTPNYMHAEQALAALAAGKHVACEKPLAGTLKDARQMRNAAVKSRKSKTFVWYNYRRCPAIALAYRFVKEGRLGRIYHVRMQFLQDWAGPDTPHSWRFDKKFAGTGAHGELNAHLIDLARFLTGQEFTEIMGAVAQTFITDRPIPASATKQHGATSVRIKQRLRSDVDDAMLFFAHMSGGTLANFEGTRVATGNQNHIGLELNGEVGSIRFSFEDMNVLQYWDDREDGRVAGWRRIMCTSAGDHPYAGAWWPDAHIIGFEHTFVNMAADILAVLGGDAPIVPLPDFNDAYETQRVMEAAMICAKHRAPIKMSEVK